MAYVLAALTAFSVVMFTALPSAHAAARKKPGTTTPTAQATGTSPFQVPVPIRPAKIAAVGTLPFTLPNGSRVDLTTDLAAMINTSTTNTNVLAPTTGSQPDQCNSWVELRTAVSTLDLNVAQIGLKFGYSMAQGETTVVTGANGNVKVNIGLIAMDFAVYQCTNQGCTSVAATTANHTTTGTEVSLEIDFGQITTGPSLVNNTPLGNIIRKIMDKGMSQLAASPAVNRLGWRSKVREFDPNSGALVFDQGAQSRIALDQGFEVYAVTPSTGICDVYKAVAYAHTTQVNTISSTAQVDQMLDSRGIKEGDIVMIRSNGPL